ncbi:MAG: DUF58 domain-containing protein [Okeania sp. SIO3B5]|uniref:DUF58 domain-containing protein n=1 Tax=Okeania sp. SIO3B5 TaxID=2607811 RepID=UPI0014012E60|nr:DUF58 domain-containing protein [Okeania sp. SIO3B5]NEO53948.1 DUF58 domain-containing protein [Okeania sp. SIO3B5]
MKIYYKISDWLETHWVTPSYAGGLLGMLSIFFFGAATNTMAGWLYVISGMSFALLGMGAVLPGRSLRQIQVRRHRIQPVTVNDYLTIALTIENSTNQPIALVQLKDEIPFVLGKSPQQAIEVIPGKEVYHWTYHLPTERRGIYRWHHLQLRSAAPLGLFWCRRSRNAKATAIVYPTVLPLSNCPIIDELGQENSRQLNEDSRYLMASEGLTRTLRPYRFGDPSRLIHWRSSARYGELRVRELEVSKGGEEVIICLDSAAHWQTDNFEAAVTAAASLYFYANRSLKNVQLWTAATGLVHGNRVVLQTLAGVNFGEEVVLGNPPNKSLLWLTQDRVSLSSLPSGSRWLLWLDESISPGTEIPKLQHSSGLKISSTQPLEFQLQSQV